MHAPTLPADAPRSARPMGAVGSAVAALPRLGRRLLALGGAVAGGRAGRPPVPAGWLDGAPVRRRPAPTEPLVGYVLWGRRAGAPERGVGAAAAADGCVPGTASRWVPSPPSPGCGCCRCSSPRPSAAATSTATWPTGSSPPRASIPGRHAARRAGTDVAGAPGRRPRSGATWCRPTARCNTGVAEVAVAPGRPRRATGRSSCGGSWPSAGVALMGVGRGGAGPRRRSRSGRRPGARRRRAAHHRAARGRAPQRGPDGRAPRVGLAVGTTLVRPLAHGSPASPSAVSARR